VASGSKSGEHNLDPREAYLKDNRLLCNSGVSDAAWHQENGLAATWCDMKSEVIRPVALTQVETGHAVR